MPDQAFLRNGSHKDAIAGEDRAAGKTACAAGKGAVLRVKKPFIGAEGAVEPERVIEACGLNFTLENSAAMGNES